MNFSPYPAPTCNQKLQEASDENPDDLQWEGVYCYMIGDTTDSVDTEGIISISSASAYVPVMNNNNNVTVIEHLESYFEYFDYHDIRGDISKPNYIYYGIYFPYLLWRSVTSFC